MVVRLFCGALPATSLLEKWPRGLHVLLRDPLLLTSAQFQADMRLAMQLPVSTLPLVTLGYIPLHLQGNSQHIMMSKCCQRHENVNPYTPKSTRYKIDNWGSCKMLTQQKRAINTLHELLKSSPHQRNLLRFATTELKGPAARYTFSPSPHTLIHRAVIT